MQRPWYESQSDYSFSKHHLMKAIISQQPLQQHKLITQAFTVINEGTVRSCVSLRFLLDCFKMTNYGFVTLFGLMIWPQWLEDKSRNIFPAANSIKLPAECRKEERICLSVLKLKAELFNILLAWVNISKTNSTTFISKSRDEPPLKDMAYFSAPEIQRLMDNMTNSVRCESQSDQFYKQLFLSCMSNGDTKAAIQLLLSLMAIQPKIVIKSLKIFTVSSIQKYLQFTNVLFSMGGNSICLIYEFVLLPRLLDAASQEASPNISVLGSQVIAWAAYYTNFRHKILNEKPLAIQTSLVFQKYLPTDVMHDNCPKPTLKELQGKVLCEQQLPISNISHYTEIAVKLCNKFLINSSVQAEAESKNSSGKRLSISQSQTFSTETSNWKSQGSFIKQTKLKKQLIRSKLLINKTEECEIGFICHNEGTQIVVSVFVTALKDFNTLTVFDFQSPSWIQMKAVTASQRVKVTAKSQIQFTYRCSILNMMPDNLYELPQLTLALDNSRVPISLPVTIFRFLAEESPTLGLIQTSDKSQPMCSFRASQKVLPQLEDVVKYFPKAQSFHEPTVIWVALSYQQSKLLLRFSKELQIEVKVYSEPSNQRAMRPFVEIIQNVFY